MLPISSIPLTSLDALFSEQVEEIARLLRPGSRKRVEAQSKLRALMITDDALTGNVGQPSVRELTRRTKAIRAGASWDDLFPGVAALETTTTGIGPSIALRLSKKEGVQVEVVPEGTPGAGKLALKRVNELDFYNLGHNQVAEKIGLTPAKAGAVIWHLNLKQDLNCFKEITIGSSIYQRFSQHAPKVLKDFLATADVDAIWEQYKSRHKTDSKT